MQERATWKEVEEKVMQIDEQLGPAFAVHGKLSGPDVSRVKSRHIRLVVICDSTEKRNALVDAVRILISPWQLLHKRMKEVLVDPNLSDKALKALSICTGKKSGTVEDHCRDEPSTFVRMMEEGAPITERVNLFCGYVETIATIIKKSVPAAKDMAEEVADYAKCVSVVGSALQVVVMCATLAEMGMEMKRGKVEWPRIQSRVKHLHRVVLDCMSHVLHPDGHVDELLVKSIFKVQQELVDVLGEVEEEMMRDSGALESVKRFMKANKLKRVEEELKRLEGSVLETIQSSSIADIQRDVKELKQNAHPPADKFKPCFDSPSLPSNLVFDFETCDDEGAHITSEGILLNSVLQLGEQGNSQGASALGTHGMGGVGKTTALKKICCTESVRQVFVDGVCYMQFGQDVTLQKMIEEIRRCVRNFGGVEEAKDMRSAANLEVVVNRAAEWLRDKAVLLVCDDLWTSVDNELGYVAELKNMLRDAPKSGLLISTRDRTIAQAVSSSPVNFECVEPQGRKAREILGTAAFGPDWQQAVSDWDGGSEYVGILNVCAGLPLALGIAGSGVKEDYVDSRNASFAVKNYWGGLMKGGLKHLQGANVEYHADGLKYVIEASLQLCAVWGSSGGRNYDLRRLFRSLCILEKQQLIPESTLELYWRLDKQQVGEVVRKFTNLNIVKRELVDRSTSDNRQVPQFFIRLHDLVLELCQEMELDKQEEWHMRLVGSYRSTLEDGKEMETQSMDWWEVKDDGYVYENLSRHLVASGCWTGLEALVSDVRWTLRRFEMGGRSGLDTDFKRLREVLSSPDKGHMHKLHLLIKRSWHWLRRDQTLFAYEVFGYLSRQERQSKYVSEYLESVTKHFPSPWLRPMTKCIVPEDSREQSRWNIERNIFDLAVSWLSDRAVIASDSGIHLWSISLQEELFEIPTDTEECALSVSLSEDAKTIVSGHRNGTVRRWNAHTGESVGLPISVQLGSICCVAIRGNLIVSGSNNYLLNRWNAFTGEATGDALWGHENEVCSIAISADGKLIVSGSLDGIIRQWDAESGEPVGCPIRADPGKLSLAVSSDAEVIFAGTSFGTISRWRASTGEVLSESLGHIHGIQDLAISEDGERIVSCSSSGDMRLWNASSDEPLGLPLRGHQNCVNCVAMSRDGNLIMSGSADGTVRYWDVSAKRNVSERRWVSTTQEHEDCSTMNWASNVSVSANGKLAVSVSVSTTAQRWDVLTGEAVGSPMLGHSNRGGVYCAAISRNGALIVTGGEDNMVRRWDGSTGEAIGKPMDGHSGCVYAVVISDDEKLIVTGADDNTVRRWNAETGEAIGIPMVGHSSWVADLAISADGNLIVSCSDDWSMLRWNAKTGEKIDNRIKVPGLPEHVETSKDGKIIACGSSYYNYVQRWETMTGHRVGEEMHWSSGQHVLDEMKRARLSGDKECDTVLRKDSLPIEVCCRAVCPDGSKIVLGLQNGNVVVCERR